MASIAESEAYFEARCREYGVPPVLQTALNRAGISTLGHLAFAMNRPGQEFDEARFDQWLAQVNGGAAPTLGATAIVRRLHFEAEIVLTASLKASIEQPDRDGIAPKPLPYAERTARMATLQGQLPGLNLDGIHEPSLALVDECVHQYDSRTLRYVEPAKCGSRETEVATSRKDKQLRVEVTTLSIKETKNTPDEDTSTAYKLNLCLRRRAIAYELAGLFTFTTMEQYIDQLMRRLHVEAPPGYQATTISQLLRADREVFVRLAQTVRDIRPNAAGVKPLDEALNRVLQDYSVMFHLVPLPVQAASSSTYTASKSKRDESPSAPYQPRQKGGGKSKGKGKKGGSAVAPRGYKNCVGRDQKGRSLCFDFNLGKCNKAAAGASCDRGRHVCFKFGCYKPHRFSEAHKEEMPSNE